MTTDTRTFSPHPSGPERRRRARLACHASGWLILERDASAEPWEIRMRDLSRLGVGFDCGMPLATGDIMRIRVGRGPMKLARQIRIVNCMEQQDQSYAIGGEFCR